METTKKKFNANNVELGGAYPYVVRTSENNGIKGWIDADIQYLNSGNTISFGQDTATVFYQEHPYFTGDKIKILSCKYQLNKEIASYLVTAIRKAFSGFSWGVTSFNESILKKTKITLPVSKNGDVDFAFMENYIKEIEHVCIMEMGQARTQEINAYLKVDGLKDCVLTSEESNAISIFHSKEFCDYQICSLFDIDTGRDVIISSVENGDIPLISHQHNNNGISKRIKKLNNRKLFDYRQTLALADRGVFYATTQAENFHIGTRVKALTFKEGIQEENVRLFFVASINKLQVLFKDYLVNATDKLPSLQIKLPITSSGEIDYHFMEVYIRAQKKLAIQRIKEWRAKEITETKNIVDEEHSKIIPLTPKPAPIPYSVDGDYAPSMVAEDIFISGSLEVQLRNTKREELLAGNLDLILMYAITPSARKKTERSGKIALGIKEDNLSAEAIKAFECVKHIMFHYWKNSEATPFKLTSATRLVEESDIPEGYLVRQHKGAKLYLLIEYDANNPSEIGAYDILKVQRQNEARYSPFVCKVENIK